MFLVFVCISPAWLARRPGSSKLMEMALKGRYLSWVTTKFQGGKPPKFLGLFALGCFLFARSRGALPSLFAQEHTPSTPGGHAARSLCLVAIPGYLRGKGVKILTRDVSLIAKYLFSGSAGPPSPVLHDGPDTLVLAQEYV